MAFSKTIFGKGSVLAIAMGLAAANTAGAQSTNTIYGNSSENSSQSGNTSNSSNSSNSNSSSSSSSDSTNPYSSSQTFGSLNVNEPSNSINLLSVDSARSSSQATGSGATDNLVKRAPLPGEFEKYVEHVLGRKVPLYGTKFVLPSLRDFAAPATATVPPDYIVQPGDTIDIALSGSLDGSVSRTVDTNGRIFLTGVGSLHVAGIRNSDLHEVVARAIGTKFRGFTAAVTVTKLRGIRVYVTGLANNPGAFTVSSLSTLANAVFQAGGPNSGGSWRTIKLYRNGHEISNFDLYQLMRGGSRVNDVQLQNEDVLFIPPAGAQVAVTGSVHEEAIYEALPGESVAAILAAAGGPNTVGDPSRFVLYRSDAPSEAGPLQFDMAKASGMPVRGGDIVQLLSTGTLTMPVEQQRLVVRLEGEVRKPGIYYVEPGTKAEDVIAQAGGLTSRAYVFGTKMTRESERILQQDSYTEALNQLEISLASTPLSQDTTLPSGDRSAQLTAARAVLERLRQAKPDGRIVLDVSPAARVLPPSLVLENNDSLYIPKQASTVSVFGAVYRPTSFLLGGDHSAKRVRDYIEEAGGTLRTADRGGIFVVRANGAVISKKRGAPDMRVLPGDVIFVPVRTQPNMFWAKLGQITSTLFSFGLSTAAVVAVTK